MSDDLAWLNGSRSIREAQELERNLAAYASMLRPPPVVLASPPSFTLSPSAASAAALTPQISGGVPVLANDARLRFGRFGMFDALAATGVAGSLASATSSTNTYVSSIGDLPLHAQFVFDTDADKIEVKFKAENFVGTTSYPFMYRIWINGQPSTQFMATNLTPTVGLWYSLLVDFGSSALRSIEVELMGVAMISVAVGPTYTVFPSSIPKGPNVLVIGDSYTTGVGTPETGIFDSWPNVMGRALGWNIFLSGIRSTGYAYPPADTNPLGSNTCNYLVRAAHDFGGVNSAVGIEKVVATGGVNDARNLIAPAVTQAAATALFTWISENIPKARQMVILPFSFFGTDTPASGQYPGLFTKTKNTSAAIKAAADAFQCHADPDGLPWVDPLTTGDLWFTGSGYVGHETGDGNCDRYITADFTHPTAIGHAYLGRRAAAAILAAMP